MPENSKPIVPTGSFIVGTVIPFNGPLNQDQFEQQGWLYCNGSTISRTKYSELFQVIGTIHGSGDNISTFNLPDYRGTFLRGVDQGSKNDPDAANRIAASPGGNTGDAVGSMQNYATGRPVIEFQLNQTGEHTHSIMHIPTDNSSYAIAGNYQSIWNDGNVDTSSAGEHNHSFTGGDSETRPLNVSCYFLIRYSAMNQEA